MAQAGVERILGKLVTDEAFRAAFFQNPAAASFAVGIRLSPAELDALHRIPADALEDFSTRLDARVCRFCLTAERDSGRELQAASDGPDVEE